MNDVKDLEKRIIQIEQRNKLVETSKAWETSWTRRIILFLLTYLAIGGYLMAIRVNQPWLNAIVPAIGFILSTLSLPLFKKLWEKYIFYKKS